MIVITALTRMNSNPPTWQGSTEDGDYIFIRHRHNCIKVGTAATAQEFWHPDRNSCRSNVLVKPTDISFEGLHSLELLKKYLEPHISFKL